MIPSGHDLAGLVQPWAWSRADLSWGLGLAYDMIFAVDCGWALFGYATESRWIGNKTRSVEPTAFGWVVCLACYPPFNNVLGTYLPLENGPQLIASENGHLWLRGAVVLLFTIYAAATVSFGFRFSNLTNRGIVSRGPYKYVRHPAYLTKCTAWWLEHIPTMTITKAFFLTLLCGVYALRAWTEERHLSKDPDYLVYKKKTPWILFPGIY
jgi:protein-S-isoprenylcysteine O-methyltransferase Ste14